MTTPSAADSNPPELGFENEPRDDFTIRKPGGSPRRYLRMFGEVRCLSAWAKLYGISKCTINIRLREGSTIEEAITKPARITAPRKRLHSLKKRAEVEEIVYVHENGKIVRIFRTEKLSAQNLAAVKEAGLKAKKYFANLNAAETLAILEKEFRERKFEAYRRLIKEQRYQPFRTLCTFYRRSLHGQNIKLNNHVIFYMALESFPKPDDFSDL